jgi:hypothetical protein
MTVVSEYEVRIAAARAAFARRASLVQLWSPSVDPLRLHLFLVHFSAFGVRMTEPVEGWIRRAGERCVATGMESLGRALEKHAKHEAGHHMMMIADTKLMVARWNETHVPHLDAEALLAASPPAGVRAYVNLHERVIAGKSPYGQLAIELEIERLSVEYGAPLIANAVARLGKPIMTGLSFLEEHVAVDVGHTRFNEQRMAELLGARPDALEPLVESGSEALACYGQFLDDALEVADGVLRAPG